MKNIALACKSDSSGARFERGGGEGDPLVG